MNRAQKRKTNGVNKRGLHKKDKHLTLIYGREMWKQYTQTIVYPEGTKKVITHTQFVR